MLYTNTFELRYKRNVSLVRHFLSQEPTSQFPHFFSGFEIRADLRAAI